MVCLGLGGKKTSVTQSRVKALLGIGITTNFNLQFSVYILKNVAAILQANKFYQQIGNIYIISAWLIQISIYLVKQMLYWLANVVAKTLVGGVQLGFTSPCGLEYCLWLDCSWYFKLYQLVYTVQEASSSNYILMPELFASILQIFQTIKFYEKFLNVICT